MVLHIPAAPEEPAALQWRPVQTDSVRTVIYASAHSCMKNCSLNMALLIDSAFYSSVSFLFILFSIEFIQLLSLIYYTCVNWNVQSFLLPETGMCNETGMSRKTGRNPPACLLMLNYNFLSFSPDQRPPHIEDVPRASSGKKNFPFTL